jgi:hypothetical protein
MPAYFGIRDLNVYFTLRNPNTHCRVRDPSFYYSGYDLGFLRGDWNGFLYTKLSR